MGPKKKMRAVSGDNFGGSAADLPESDLPTHKDIARYFYSVSLTEKDYHIVRDGLKPWSFLPNRGPKMQERHQLFFGLRLASKEFQHPAIQTNIEQHFWRIFPTNKSVSANRKTGFYANRDPNKQEVEFIFAWSGSELWSFSNIQEWNWKIKNLSRLMSFSRPTQ